MTPGMGQLGRLLRTVVVATIVRRGLARARTDRDVAGSLAPLPSSPVWVLLLVGSDRRADAANGVRGARADAIAVAVCDPARRELVILRISRDVQVELPGIGRQKLGWALDYGGPALQVQAVRALVGCAIQHYLELEFAGFVALVDAIGGVDVNLPEPAVDSLAELRLDAGHTVADGRTALGLARARHHESDLGQNPLGDDVRIGRQNALLVATLDRLRGRRDPVTMLRWFGRVAPHLTVDDRLDPARLMRYLGDAVRARVQMFSLPAVPARREEELRSPFPPHQMNSSKVLVLQQPEAALVLEEVRSHAEEVTRS